MKTKELSSYGQFNICRDVTIGNLKRQCACDSESYPSKEYLDSTRFHVTSHGTFDLFLAQFDQRVFGEEVENAARDMGFKVAGAAELLLLGTRPECRSLQLCFTIAALGQFVNIRNHRRVACLGKGGFRANPPCVGPRRLFLGWKDALWSAQCRFLFVGDDYDVV